MSDMAVRFTPHTDRLVITDRKTHDLLVSKGFHAKELGPSSWEMFLPDVDKFPGMQRELYDTRYRRDVKKWHEQ